MEALLVVIPILGGLAVLGIFIGPLAALLGLRPSKRRGTRDVY